MTVTQEWPVSELDELARELGVYGGVRRDEPMAKHTTYRVGGPADLYLAARSAENLAAAWRHCRERGVPVTVVGGGSNLLVADAGIRGVVIRNEARHLQFLPRTRRADEPGAEWRARAETGATYIGLSQKAAEKGLTGLEWAVSIPGTVGGAVVNNAGAHGGCTADAVERVYVLERSGATRWLTFDELALAYRDSRFRRQVRVEGEIIESLLTVEFRLRRGDPAEITATMASFVAHRKATQPVGPSAGSVFKNPPGDAAGRLIEQAGLKGHRIGAAEISPRHANFIVNRGGASAAEVRALVELAHDEVRRRFGVDLEPEVQMLGVWS